MYSSKLKPKEIPEEKKIFLDYLNKIKNEKNYSNAKVLEELNKHYDIPLGTFNNTIDTQKPNLNEMVVLAFCKRFGYNIYDIYYDKERKAGKAPEKENTAVVRNNTDTVNPELPAGFYGTFYGYFFNSDKSVYNEGTIDMFTLNIQKDGISMQLIHNIPNVKSKNTCDCCEIFLNGKVIHNQGGTFQNGIIVLSFNSEKDDCFCTIAYNKFQFDGQLYFCRGALLISRHGGEIMPVLQSFIFTDRKINLKDSDNEKMIQGVLKLTNKTLLIEKNKLDKFMGSKLLTQYFEKMSYDNACKEYVELNEDFIQSINIEKNELYQTFLNIRADSFNSDFYVFPAVEYFWHYIACLCDRDEPPRE